MLYLTAIYLCNDLCISCVLTTFNNDDNDNDDDDDDGNWCVVQQQRHRSAIVFADRRNATAS